MKRRELIQRMGTLAIFSLTPLAVVEGIQLPSEAEDKKQPFGKPLYQGEIKPLQWTACRTGSYLCNVGVNGNCATGTITCSNGSYC
ncbi:hypothetical protein GG496_001705 [Candidatus Fervidibacteria bacterium JGI MDM2 JNZ-1-D12]